MKKHNKHAKLTRRNYGNYTVNEIAFIGTKCNEVSKIVAKITDDLASKTKIAYLDASHDKTVSAPLYDTFTFHPAGILNSERSSNSNHYNDRILFSDYDMVLVNGNHFQADQQILILDNDKETSVKKRISQLTNVQFIIRLTKDAELFDFLKETHPELENLNTYYIGETEKISSHIYNLIQGTVPKINGLVLAGGKSTRMGSDKGLLNYFGTSQRDFAVSMLEKLDFQTYLSVRKEQNIQREHVIEDVFLGLGPFGAICSAFQNDPNSAWLVLATDLPFVDENLIRLLLKERDPSKIATAIKGKEKPFPEPLITIWEPKAYPRMLSFLAQGISCPRKVLINSDVKIVEVEDELIANVNTPEEFEMVKKKLNG